MASFWANLIKDPFWADLTKIVVERLLLAAILVWLAFYAGRILHRFRARNVYYQRLTEEKLAGLKDASLICAQQLVRLARLRSILKRATPKAPDGRDRFASDFKGAFKDLAHHYDDRAATLLNNVSLFAPPDTTELAESFQMQALRFFDTLCDLDGSASDQQNETVRALSEALTKLQQAIAQEMRVPPAV